MHERVGLSPPFPLCGVEAGSSEGAGPEFAPRHAFDPNAVVSPCARIIGGKTSNETQGLTRQQDATAASPTGNFTGRVASGAPEDELERPRHVLALERSQAFDAVGRPADRQFENVVEDGESPPRAAVRPRENVLPAQNRGKTVEQIRIRESKNVVGSRTECAVVDDLIDQAREVDGIPHFGVNREDRFRIARLGTQEQNDPGIVADLAHPPDEPLQRCGLRVQLLEDLRAYDRAIGPGGGDLGLQFGEAA